MNLEFFIAKRLIKHKGYKGSISAPIIKIAIFAISIGVVMMLIAIATGLGLQHKIREKIAAFNGHIQIFNYDNNISDVSVNPISINQEFYPEFNQIEGISHIQAVATKGGIIRTEKTFEGIIAKGVGADYDWQFFQDFLIAGRLPNYSTKRNEEILISAYLANRLHLEIGDTFWSFFLKENAKHMPHQLKLQIVGIYDSGFREFDSNYIFIDIRHIQRMNKWEADEIGSFEVFVTDFDKIQQKEREIYGTILSELDSQTIVEKYFVIFEWLSLFDFNIAIIIGIMILVGGINMITALLVLILERTQMIGLLKALGSSDRSIRKIFIYNAVYLITVGLFWGNIIGLGFLFIQNKIGIIPLDPNTYYVSQAPVHIGLIHIIILNIGVLFLCVLMLLIPSYIITKVTPVKAIKFE